MTEQRSTKALIILDGFGVEATESSAVMAANTPTWDRLMANAPNSRIATSGMAVGLPDGQMGNSEVGHMNIGAGRTVYQNYTRISKAIDDGSLFENEVLVNAIDKAKAADGAVHVMGLLSPGGVHSHEEHIFALLEMAVKRVSARFTCTAYWMVVICHHAVHSHPLKLQRKSLRSWVPVHWQPLWAATMQWTVITAGTVCRPHTMP